MSLKLRRLFLLLFIALLSVQVIAQPFAPVRATHGMVVTADSLASEIGFKILKKGGNAVDAAVAVAFTLAVTFPNAGNIGGGGFMLIRTPQNKVLALDYRERAPLLASKDMYLDSTGAVIEGASLIGYQACGVPGTVYGLWAAHQRFGRLKWKDLLQPAIELAQKGFALNQFQARLLNSARELFNRFPATAKIFVARDSSGFRAGDRLVQKDLASTLKRIAKSGIKDFYQGKTADLIAKDMAAHGGLITKKDLRQYRSVWRKPIRIQYRGFTIFSMPLPSSGGIVLGELLNTLSFFDVKQLGHNSSQYIHLLTEIERHIYRDRAHYLGDADFVQVEVERLLSRAHADSIRNNLSLLTAGKSVPDFQPLPEESKETTHFSIVDARGWAVSNTYTLNGNYGSGVVIEGTGILMNNEMDDFSIKPGHPNMFGLVGSQANAIAPGKRMLSSMTPTIVTRNDSLRLVLGSPGGSTIITTVAQVLINAIDFKMNIRRAVEAPRFHHQWLPDVVFLEKNGFSRDTIHNLENLGYRISFTDYLGLVQAIQVEKHGLFGWSDPRGTGLVKGY